MEYSDHYQLRDMINIPGKSYIIVCDLLKVWALKH